MISKQFSIEEIQTKIYLIRGRKVMLSSDLSHLYGVTTFNLNKAVKRNLARFPEDFMFQLTNQEVRDLTFQFGISSLSFSNLGSNHGGRRRAPYVFTQEGVSMLSSVLKSEQAIQVNVAIMRAFVKIREMSISHQDLGLKIAELERKYDGQFKVVFEAIKELMSNRAVPPKRIIGLGFSKK